MTATGIDSLAAVGDTTGVLFDVAALAGLQVGAGDELGRAVLLGDVAGAAQVFRGVLVVDQELSVLAEAMGLVVSHGDHVEDVGGLEEDCVHLFQRPICGLGIEEVDHREDEGVAGKVLVREVEDASEGTHMTAKMM